MSPKLCGYLHLIRKHLASKMKMADGSEGGVFGDVINVPLCIGGLTYHMTFLAVSKVPFEFIIGEARLKGVKLSLNLNKETAIFMDDLLMVTLPLWTKEDL